MENSAIIILFRMNKVHQKKRLGNEVVHFCNFSGTLLSEWKRNIKTTRL